MDAPQTQYRVIERGGRLIVLDTRTNLPPKQAVDLHPGRESRASQTRVSAKDLMQKQRSAKRRSERSGRTGPMMRSPGAAGTSTRGGAHVIGTLIFATSFIVVAVIIGGAVGFAIAGVGLLVAGRSIFKIGSASRKLG